jgi:hypothetical protein
MDTYINEDVESLRKTVQDLLAKLQEAERQHQSDRVTFEVRFGIWGEGAPRDGLLDAGANDFLDMDFMFSWPSATNWKSKTLRPGILLSAFPFPGWISQGLLSKFCP